MSKSRLSDAAFSAGFVVLASLPTSVLALSLGDGGTYTIDYAVGDGLTVDNHTTVTVNNGAYITDAAGGSSDTVGVYDSTFNLNGGYIQGSIKSGTTCVSAPPCEKQALNISDGYIAGGIGNAHVPGASASAGLPINITGGTIEGSVFSAYGPVDISGEPYGSLDISGGNLLGGIVADADTHVSISGGNISSLYLLDFSRGEITGGLFFGDSIRNSGYLDISGGTFEVDTVRTSGPKTTSIEGGSFSKDTVFSLLWEPTTTLKFYGDLSLTDPVVNASGDYEEWINGTLADGSPISNLIICSINASGPTLIPCVGSVSIESVPSPPALWLFGSGLLGLIGIARRKNAA